MHITPTWVTRGREVRATSRRAALWEGARPASATGEVARGALCRPGSGGRLADALKLRCTAFLLLPQVECGQGLRQLAWPIGQLQLWVLHWTHSEKAVAAVAAVHHASTSSTC